MRRVHVTSYRKYIKQTEEGDNVYQIPFLRSQCLGFGRIAKTALSGSTCSVPTKAEGKPPRRAIFTCYVVGVKNVNLDINTERSEN